MLHFFQGKILVLFSLILSRVSPINIGTFEESHLRRFNIGDDCPIFEGLYDYCRLYSGGSIDGAVRLNHGLCDIAVNWSGGLHHARYVIIIILLFFVFFFL